MRRNTAAYSSRISEALTSRGIKHEVLHSSYGDDVITIDRTSMVEHWSTGDEHSAYEATLAYLRKICGEAAHVMWAGRTDDWLGVEVHAKDPA